MSEETFHNDKCPVCGQRKTESEIAGAFCRYCGWLESIITPSPWEDLHADPDQYGTYGLPQAAEEEDTWAEEPYLKPEGYASEEDAEIESDLRHHIARLHDRNNARMMSAVPEFWVLYQVAHKLVMPGEHHLPLPPAGAGELWGEVRRAVEAVARTRIANLETVVPSDSLPGRESHERTELQA